MTLASLDHVTIVTSDLERATAFYVDVLGLSEGDRPAFDFPGAWLYCGQAPVLHLVARKGSPSGPTGAIDHIAFRASGFDAFKIRLAQHDISFDERHVPGTSLHQIFVTDPDGVKVEINFDVNVAA